MFQTVAFGSLREIKQRKKRQYDLQTNILWLFQEKDIIWLRDLGWLTTEAYSVQCFSYAGFSVNDR